jgi:hypothetical protein
MKLINDALPNGVLKYSLLNFGTMDPNRHEIVLVLPCLLPNKRKCP